MMMTQKDHSAPVKVYSSYIQSDVIAAKMILQENEIEYFTQNEEVAAIYPIPGMGNIDFFVNRKDFDKARAVLAPLIQGDNE